ncbi:hypothetical protein GGR01_000409 [Acetobacter oeni]|nr:hypothetical protein [Acetobacter oeni]
MQRRNQNPGRVSLSGASTKTTEKMRRTRTNKRAAANLTVAAALLRNGSSERSHHF